MAYLKNMKFLILILIIIIAALWVIGNNVNRGLPEDLLKKVSKLPDRIMVAKKNLEKYQIDYSQMNKSGDSYKFMKEISEKENLESIFQKANQQINQASLIYENNIVPLAKKNDVQKAALLNTHMQEIDELLKQAEGNMKYPSDRITKIQEIIKDPEYFHKTSVKQASQFSSMVKELENKIVPKIKQDFPEIAYKVDKRFSPLIELEHKLSHAANIVEDMFLNHQAGNNIDFSIFTDNVDIISNQYNILENTKTKYKKMLLAVYISYNKILDDMKEEIIPGNNTPSYFHKYFIEMNGNINKNQDWIQVSKDFYNANKDNLGMAIISKKIGQFEDEANPHPVPPGLSYMGDPKYGQWKTDSNGNQFWSWYGKYAFFSTLFAFPPRSFGYNRWDTFNRNYRYDRPYYGKTSNGYRQYGTKGSFTKQSSRYQSSSFGQTGGFSSQSPSVKKAASTIRGGGPGSRGK